MAPGLLSHLLTSPSHPPRSSCRGCKREARGLLIHRSARERRENRELILLEAVAETEHISQRTLSLRLGIALGLTNLYVKRLIRKGYIKCVGIQGNRLRYLLTAKGIGEKVRLTREFMGHSLKLYAASRRHLGAALEPLVRAGHRHFAIFGTGEAGELAYVSLRSFGLEPVAIFGDPVKTPTFLGIPVRPLATHHEVEYDLLIVASLAQSGDEMMALQLHGLSPDRICTLLPAAPSTV